MRDMNARNYKVKVAYTNLDVPVTEGFASRAKATDTDAPCMMDGQLVLGITELLGLIEEDTQAKHVIFAAKSTYHIPPDEIDSRDDVYAFYEDASLTLRETYEILQEEIEDLPEMIIEPAPQQDLKREIDSVFALLSLRKVSES